MATDFSTATAVVSPPAPYHPQLPTQQYPQAPSHAYKTSGHYSQMASGANTPNLSPTSPKTHIPHHPPQIRPPKAALYIPAALRKTEKPQRESPPKVDTPIDGADGTWNTKFGRRQTGLSVDSDVSRIVTGDFVEPMSPVAGPVTRDHWQPDNSTLVCTASSCQQPFTFWNRRHHCRRCGGIFCSAHSSQFVKLNEDALFHPDGCLQRACDRCCTDFRKWEHLRSSRHNSESSENSSAMEMPTPTVSAAPKRPDNARASSLATSFQNAWNWSTF